jgi:putative transposase
VRRECLDRILIVSRGHLERVLREYVAYHNTHRPHRALEQQPPRGVRKLGRGCRSRLPQGR